MRNTFRFNTLLALAASACMAFGCHSKSEVHFTGDNNGFQPFGTQIEYPSPSVVPASAIAESPMRPNTLREPTPDETWSLSLDEAIQLGLQNSRVMREIGARVVSSPQSMSTVYDTALQITNPFSGEEAALSAFDANFATNLFLGREDQSFNNPLFAGAGFDSGAASLTTQSGAFDAAISKTAATGTQMALRNRTNRTSRNSRFELFPSYYETVFEAEVRQPLLRGFGLEFNRIAGPNAQPGSYNGILVARVQTDLALADFERSVRNYIEDIQQIYWQLYFAYRNLDARIAARDAALEEWRTEKVKLDVGTRNSADEALAREQYYLFQSQVADALSGVGSDTSTSASPFGVYVLERRLRLLLGIELNDGRLIRPADEPTQAEVIFDWDEAVDLAMFRRVELRRQQWIIQRREMELLAARNQLFMRLDLVAQYRRRGFGDKLFGQRDRENGSAFRDLWAGDLDGWQAGMQLSTPIGNRIGHVAVRNAQLQLQRERALLQEQERYIFAEVNEAFSELDRAYVQARTYFNRAIAARRRADALRAREEEGDVELQFVLDAESRAADAQAEFFRSLVDYNLAIAKIHFTQGTLLDYYGVRLTEGAWAGDAYDSAARNARRFKRRHLNYCITRPFAVGRGEFDQEILPRGPLAEELPSPPPSESTSPAEPYDSTDAPAAPPLPESTDTPAFEPLPESTDADPQNLENPNFKVPEFDDPSRRTPPFDDGASIAPEPRRLATP